MRTKFRSSFRRGGVALLAVMTVLSFAIAVVEGGVLKEARVTQVIKDVKLLPSQAAPRAATVNDDVRGDTGVRTGGDSRAELTFADLTIARLGANTIFSFNEGTRTIALSSGAILLRVPKDSGGAKVQTAAVTAAITGTTVMVEFHPKSYAKYLVLEGTMRIYLKGVLGESALMTAGQMMIVNPNATRLSEVVDFDVARLWKTSLLTQGFSRPLGSEPLVANAQHVQLERKAAGELLDTNLVIFGRGTLVTMTDPQSLDTIDRKTAAVTLPTPAPPTPTPTPPPVPTPTPTPVQTPVPTPSKFGTPPPIASFVPYPIDNGTVIQTDPAITRAGVTDFGKIYRDAVQDGPFSTWAFTVTSLFDLSVGINAPYASNNPVAAFKFVGLQLVGNPTISTANGGATNLALISVGPMTSSAAGTGNTAFTFDGMQSVLLATQNGSITLGGISFQNIPLLIFYARGASGHLNLGSPITNVASLRLIGEGSILITGTGYALANGSFGGILSGTSGGPFGMSVPIITPTGLTAPGNFLGAGGTVSLSALAGTLNVTSDIQVSSNDPDTGTLLRRSASGGTIGLDSGLTTGTGIRLSSRLLSLLNDGAPGPGGSITLTTAGSDIITNGATIQADRGTITIQHSAAPSIGTAQITLDGGTIQSETLLASSRGNLSVGTTSPVNLNAVTLSLLASNNLTWAGGTHTATASASSGNVIFQSGNDLTITNAFNIQRTNGGITDGVNIQMNAGQNFNANQGLILGTDGSGLTSGGNITVSSGAAMTIGLALIGTGPRTANQQGGSNITINAGGPITAADLFAQVAIGAGQTLGNGGNMALTGTGNYLATQGDGGLNLQVINSSPGLIGTGGNISLTLGGSLLTGPEGALTMAINNSNGGRIQTGGNINAMVGGDVNTNRINLQIDNRVNGFIGNGAGMTFNVTGTLTTMVDANFTILNSMLGTPGGTIGSNAFINITLADTNIGRDLNAFIDNSDASIGGAGGTVTLQINGTLTVNGRTNVFGTLNSTGTITTGQLSATDVNAPVIDVLNGGITRFSFPNEPTINPLHTITTGALTSTGGINFNGPDFGTPPGFGPFDGGQLTINVPTLTFGPAATDNIQGPVTFNGGDSPNTTTPAASGGLFTLNATGAITVNSPIEATTGRRPDAASPSGAGGTVNFNSTNGTIDIGSSVLVSSAEVSPPAPPLPPRRRSASGGNINLQSAAPTGIAINIRNTGQLLSLLDAAAPGPGGKITILATGANSRVNVTGGTNPGGGAPPDSIRADRGSVDIRHTGTNGFIGLTTSNIIADIVKVGALGDNGVLTIGGGVINANTVLKLYAIGPNGSVVFISDVTLNGNSMKIIAGNSVTVNQNVTVAVGGGQRAQVYVLDPARANYSNFNGGNNSTNGRFIIDGTQASPVSGADTFLGIAPPAFGPPGSP